MHQRQSRRADKRRGHTTRGSEQALRQVLKPQRVRPPATSGHTKRQASDHISARFPSLTFKNILGFCTFLSPKLRGLDKNKQINVYFWPVFDLFGLKIRSDRMTEDSWAMPELMNAGLLYKAGYYLESLQKVPPPHLGSDKCLLPP